MNTDKDHASYASTPITIQCQSREGRASWTLTCVGLPHLRDCRARLVWRYEGETSWRDNLIDLPAFSGDRFAATLHVSDFTLDVTSQRTPNGGWECGGRLSNAGTRQIELSRFHYLDGVVATNILVSMQFRQGGLPYCHHLGKQVPPLRPQQAKAEAWWEVPARDNWLTDVIYDEPDWACTVDSAVLIKGYAEPGWILGATGPGGAAGEIGVRSAGADAGHFFAGQLLDNILLGPGETRELERLLILAGDWQEGMREWASVCGRELGASSRKDQPMVGFCSWVRNFGEITVADIDRAIGEFAEMPLPPGGRMIQIDDGFQVAPGDWQPNSRFPTEWWKQLPEKISATGSIPALWLAPLSVLETNPIVKEHPEWFQRFPDGRFPMPMMNWGWCDNPSWRFMERGGHLAYNLEIDHPDARKFVRRLLRDLVDAGWRAFKLDFCYMLSSTRAAYDRRKTGFETLRDQYRLFREAVGPDVLLNACGGAPSRFPIGYADSARLSGDMVGDWSTIRSLLPLFMIRALITNGIWWAGDPDVFCVRRENLTVTGSYFDDVPLSKSEEERSFLLAVMGIMGGMLYTSDLPSEWSEPARKKVLEYWGSDSPAPARNPRLVFDAQTDLPVACKAERIIDGQPRIYCGLFNWNDEGGTVQVRLSDLGLNPDLNWALREADEGVLLRNKQLVSTQPPHSARTVLLRTDN